MANKSRETANLVSATGISTLSTRVDISNGPLLIGTATSTGTADQDLQVVGGAYFSGSVGIGTTNPAETIHLGGASNKQIRVDSFNTIPAYFGTFNNSASIAVNRRVSDGTLINSTRSAAFITLSGEATGSYITFNTADTVNTQPVGRLIINESGYAGFGTDQTSTVLSRFQVALGESIPADNGNIFTISSASGNLVEKLNMGVTTGYAWIQATKPGTTVRPLVLNPAGSYVGIGTTNPNRLLSIVGGINAEFNIVANSYSTNNKIWNFVVDGDTGVNPLANKFYFRRLNDAGSSTQFISYLITSDNRFIINPNTSLLGSASYYSSTANFQVHGSTYFDTGTSGGVGIATTNPVARLDIDGDACETSTVAIGHTLSGTTTHLLLNAGNSTTKGEHPILATCDASSVNGSKNGWFLYDNNTAGDLQLYRKQGPSAPGTQVPVIAFDRSQTQVAIGTDAPLTIVPVPLFVRSGDTSGFSNVAFFGTGNPSNSGLNGGTAIVANSTSLYGGLESLGLGSGLQFRTNPSGSAIISAHYSPAGIHTVGNQPAFVAVRSGNQINVTTTAGSYNVIIYNQANQNIGGHYNTATGLFTAPVSGRYLFSASIETSAVIEEFWWIINGGRSTTANAIPVNNSTPKAVDYVYLSAGDTIGVHPYDSGGAVITVNQNVYHTYFRGCLIC